MDVALEKKETRRLLLKSRLSLSKEEKDAIDEKLCDAIISLNSFERCDTVLLFCSTKNEPDLSRVAKKAKALGKNVAFPISVTESCTLDFRLIGSLGELSLGAYGILEPSTSMPKAFFTPSTLCVVPALAFDRRGYRLGYGKGYYDRFLKDFTGTAIGAISSQFLLDTLPVNETDIAVDMIITETGVVHLK